MPLKSASHWLTMSRVLIVLQRPVYVFNNSFVFLFTISNISHTNQEPVVTSKKKGRDKAMKPPREATPEPEEPEDVTEEPEEMVDPRDMIGHDGEPSDKEDGAGNLKTFGPALDYCNSCIIMHYIIGSNMSVHCLCTCIIEFLNKLLKLGKRNEMGGLLENTFC